MRLQLEELRLVRLGARSCTVKCVCTPLQLQPPAAASAGSGYETGGGAGSDSFYLTRHQSQSSPQKQVTLCCLLSLQKMSSSRRGRRLCLNSQCSAADCVSIFLGAAACTALKFYIFTEANMCVYCSVHSSAQTSTIFNVYASQPAHPLWPLCQHPISCLLTMD